MADVLGGLFNTVDPAKQEYERQQAFLNNLGNATTPQAFMARVGSNLGGQLSGGLMRAFGPQTEEERQQKAIREAAASVQESDPVKKLRAVAEKLRGLGMEGAALKVDEQADAFEERGLKRTEREEKIKKAQDRPQIVAERVKVLMDKFKMSEAEAKTIADNDTSWNAYIKPPKDYAPSEYGKMLQEAGIDPSSQEYKNKMREYATNKAKSAGGDPVAMEALKVQQKMLDIQISEMKLKGLEGKQKDAETKNRLKVLTGTEHAKKMENDITALQGQLNDWTAGYGASLAIFPKAAARTVKNKLGYIKANIGFDRLQAMRDASPTGGALGQVAVQELMALQSSLATLDQYDDPNELKKALDAVKTHYQNFLKNQLASMENGEPLSGAGAPAEAPAPAATGTPKPTLRYNPATKKLEPV